MIVYWGSLVFVTLLIVDRSLVFAFKAAVFEHARLGYDVSSVPEDIIKGNLEFYRRATNLARSKDVKVIVFPEYGIIPDINNRARLRTFLEYVPDPRKIHTIPCQEASLYKDRPILYTLSCLARNNSMIIVANMGDIQPCKGEKNCPKDGAFHFNTNVAFGGDGRLLVRYHKEHLFGEFGMDVPVGGQDPTFETELGKFATFICFDIVFQRITEVAHWKDVKAVLFPTNWINASPLFSYQYFEAWAIGNNVTLLAANVHLPGLAGLGSGIMKGREGALVYTFNPDGYSKLLITDLDWSECSKEPRSSIYIVSKNDTKEWKDDGKDVGLVCSQKVLGPAKDVHKDYRCQERDMSNFTLTKLSKSRDHVVSCHNGMCCELHYSAEEFKEDFYFGVFNGSYNAMNRYFFPEENCILARCDDLKNQSCVTFPMLSQTLFYKFHLRANFSTEFIYPSVVESGMRLTPRTEWKFKTNNQIASIGFKNPTGKPLLVAGLKARPYYRDPPYVR